MNPNFAIANAPIQGYKETGGEEGDKNKVPLLDNSGKLPVDFLYGAGAGDLTYVHSQGVASSTWSITHNLNKYPSVTVVDSAKNTIEGEVEYDSLNKVTLYFAFSFSGSAYLN